MITIRDWIATVPEEEKHIAYVGEGSAETRDFLLTGEGWTAYQDWGFYLDMAFDLSTVTDRDSRQVVAVQEDTTKTTAEAQVKTTSTSKKETYTVEKVTVSAPAETDVAPLMKQLQEDGLRLTWQILRQHTQLPGRLTATLRAVSPDTRIKKSSLMVFEVEPAVRATPAAMVTQSEFEQMESQMLVIMSQVEQHALVAAEKAADASIRADDARQSADLAAGYCRQAEDVATDTEEYIRYMDETAEEIDKIATTTIAASKTAQAAATTAADEAGKAAQAAADAASAEKYAQQNMDEAASHAQTAQEAAQSAMEAAEQAEALVELIGDTDAALDGILAIQERLIGGVAP